MNQSVNQKIDAPLREFLDSRPKIRLALRIFAIFIAFLSSLAIFSYLWIINNYYADITFDVVLFHLRFPLVGVNRELVYSFVIYALIPAICVAILFVIRPKIALIMGLILGIFLLNAQKIIKVSMLVAWQQNISLYEMLLTFIKGGYFKSFWWNEPFGAWFMVKAILWIGGIALVIFVAFWLLRKICAFMNLYAQSAIFVAVIALNVWILDSHFDLQKYFAPKDYSNFYEKNYKIEFDSTNLDFAPPHYDSNSQKRNLIVIFVESMEADFETPNLHTLANRNINFSTTQGFGGIMQVGRTSWTIAGIVGYMCGIPLNTPSIAVKSFLPNAKCVSDILATQGYKQVMIMGSDDDFAAKGAFLRSHHITSNDVKHYKKIGALPNDYPHHWGFSDSKLFEFAKDELQNMAQDSQESSGESKSDSQPFALYLLTNNTHSPDFFIESTCGAVESNYQNAINCVDSLVGEFVAWIKAQDFYKNTTILIVGDHLMNANHTIPRAQRRIYNAFINPRFCESRPESLQDSRDSGANLGTKSRNLSHFDFAPLILDSLGICTKSFGLGRNPFLWQTLLESYGTDFESQVSADSRIQESFWQRD